MVLESVMTGVIDVPALPAIRGMTIRRFRGEPDYAPMAALLNACAVVDQGDEVFTVEILANEFAHMTHCDPYRDMVFVEIDGEMIGYAYVAWRDEDSGTRLYLNRGCVHPDWRRRGLGRALLRWDERRARAIAAGHAFDGPRLFGVWCADSAAGKAALLRSEGYTVVRRNYAMRRAALDDLPDALLPPGLELRSVRPEHLRPIWDGMVEAFRDHWGSGPVTEADFERWLNDPMHDTRMWRIAWDAATGQVAGVCINTIFPEENARHNREEFWVEDLAVRRPWRKRGLGRALLVESMRLLRDGFDMTSAGLGVDADNMSGALRLYEGVGFRPVKSFSTYRKPMD